MPNEEVLAGGGVSTYTTEQVADVVNNPVVAAEEDPKAKLVSLGTGLQALPKKLVEKIRANEYIDFSELPPAKGKSRPLASNLEGQILVVQAADLMQAKRIIPDLATWSQCFALYVATLAPVQLERVAELMAYQPFSMPHKRKPASSRE